MNFGKCSLVLVQRLSKLNTASTILKKQGYYDEWPDANYDDVVNGVLIGINRYNKLRSFVMTTYARIDLTKTNYSVMKNCKILETIR